MVFNHAIKYHKDEAEKNWKTCPVCKLVRPTEKGLSQHMLLIHPEEYKMMAEDCPFCPRRFGSRNMVAKHVTIGHKRDVKNRWWRCLGCKLYFPPEWQTDHELECQLNIEAVESLKCCQDQREMFVGFHTNSKHSDRIPESWFRCSACLWAFNSKAKLECHLKVCGSAEANNGKKELLFNDGLCLIQCDFCPELLSSLEVLYQHCNTFHVPLLTGSWNLCQPCYNYFPTAEILMEHKQ